MSQCWKMSKVKSTKKKKRTRSKPLVIYHATSQYYYWERKQVWKLNQKENKTYHEEVPTMVIIFPLPLLDPHHGARRDWLLWWGSVMREGGPASVGMVWPGVSLLTDCKLQYRSVHVVQIRTCTDFSLFILCTLCALCLWSSNYPSKRDSGSERSYVYSGLYNPQRLACGFRMIAHLWLHFLSSVMFTYNMFLDRVENLLVILGI